MMQKPVVAKTSIATPTKPGNRSYQALCTSDSTEAMVRLIPTAR